MKASLLVVASFGMVAYGAVKWKSSKQLPKIHTGQVMDAAMAGNTVTQNVGDVKAPQPWGDSLPSSALRLEKVIQANISHVTNDRSIVIFKNGTSVIVKEPSINPEADAKSTLSQCQPGEVKFKAYQVEEGRTIVAFERGSVYQWMFPEDIAEVGRAPLRDIKKLLSKDEYSAITQNWHPPLHARVGLTARKWLVMDATNLRVIKILKSSSASNPNLKVGQISRGSH